MSQASMIRPLSIHEASFPVYAKCSPGAGNIVSVLTIEGEITKQAFNTAVTKVIDENAVLRATYQENTLNGAKSGYHWTLSSHRPRIDTITVPPEGDIEEMADHQMEHLMNEPFADGIPLSRFLLIQGDGIHKLFACVSHAAIDGSSIVGISRRIIQNLVCPLDTPLSSTGFPPSLWTFMPEKLAHKLGIFRCLNIFAMLIRLQKQADAGVAFSVEVPAPATEHRCVISKRQLTQAQSLALVSLAKRSNVSVHGLIGSASLQAFVDHLKNTKGESFLVKNVNTKIPLVSTMDLRRRTQPAIEDQLLGCMSSGATHSVKCHWTSNALIATDYIELARRVDSSLNVEIKKQQHWKLLRIYQTLGLGGMKKIFRDAAEKPMTMPISLANLGRLQFPSSPSLHIARFEAAAAFHANGPSISIQSNTLNDQMTLCFSSALPQMSRRTLDFYSDRTLHHLINMS